LIEFGAPLEKPKSRITKFFSADDSDFPANSQEAVGEYFASSGIPLAHVNNPSLHRMVAFYSANPTARIPSAKSIKEKYIAPTFHRILSQAGEVLSKENYALTSDGTQGVNKAAFESVTYHAILKNFEMVQGVLACQAHPEPHTGENTANLLISVSESTGATAKGLQAVVTDAGGGAKTAHRFIVVPDYPATGGRSIANLIETASSDASCQVRGHLCAVHRLQTCEKHAVAFISSTYPKFCSALDCIRSLSGTHCNSLLQLLRAISVSIKDPVTAFKTHVKTRFNSVILCSDSILRRARSILFLHHQPQLFELLDKTYRIEYANVISGIVQGLPYLRMMVDILTPIVKMTILFSGSSYPTINLIVSEILRFKAELEQQIENSDSSFLRDLGRTLKSHLDDKFVFTDLETEAYALNPLNHMYQVPNGEILLQQGLKLLKSKFLFQFRQAESGMQSPQSVAQLSSIRAATVTANEQWYSDLPLRQIVAQFDADPAELLWNDYLRSLSEGLRGSVLLMWYKDLPERMAIIKQLARSILCIPASSVASEAEFSVLNTILTKSRNRLDYQLVNQLVPVAAHIRAVNNERKQRAKRKRSQTEKDKDQQRKETVCSTLRNKAWANVSKLIQTTVTAAVTEAQQSGQFSDFINPLVPINNLPFDEEDYESEYHSEDDAGFLPNDESFSENESSDEIDENDKVSEYIPAPKRSCRTTISGNDKHFLLVSPSVADKGGITCRYVGFSDKEAVPKIKTVLTVLNADLSRFQIVSESYSPSSNASATLSLTAYGSKKFFGSRTTAINEYSLSHVSLDDPNFNQ
jgi:hypothetical protein